MLLETGFIEEIIATERNKQGAPKPFQLFLLFVKINLICWLRTVESFDSVPLKPCLSKFRDIRKRSICKISCEISNERNLKHIGV